MSHVITTVPLKKDKSVNTLVVLNLQRIVIYAFLILLLVVTLIPLYILFINASRSTEQIQQGISLLPGNSLLRNWDKLAYKDPDFNMFSAFLNSMTIAGSVTFLVQYFGSLTAYGIHVYNFKGRNTLYAFIIAVIMIPPQLGLIGFFQFMATFKMTGTFIPLIVPAIAAPGAVFFFRQYFSSVLQLELIDAARVDGSGELKTFHRIVIPIILPGLATNAIFTFVGTWNNFMLPFILLGGDKKKYTMPMMVQLLRTDIYRTEYGGIYLGIAASVIPVLVVYAFFSRYIISGIALGGVKE
jgi:ABC-type glycerol-3-phosphate transport system permease component